jgi:diguanylate cyclase (GGDEF)-like protein
MTEQKKAKLAGLQLAYSEHLPSKLSAIADVFKTLSRVGVAKTSALQKIQYLVHGVAGSAGTFGYLRLSTKAHLLEQKLAILIKNEAELSEDQKGEIAKLLDEMNASATEFTPFSEVEGIGVESRPAAHQQLIIIEDDKLLAQEMVAQLAIYGWQSQIFHTANEAKLALSTQQPAAVIVDIRLSEGLLAGTELIQQIRLEHNNYIVPTIVVSSCWDWQSRLNAVRAGANAYLVKPLDFVLLNETLDSLTSVNDDKPFQILVVEDDALLSQHYANVLTDAGMSVMTLEDPSLLLTTLDNFSPDLVLLDLYFPDCNGIEVAKIIRQDNKFTDLSIVFLSGEAEQSVQLVAMQSGADDFLQKPIDEKVLVKTITTRVLRFRALRELTRQDRMTGLLNQIAFQLQLEFEISRIQRSDLPLSVVVLDIDKFKLINDGYGHPVGDAVIKSLARLLKKRLRRTDIIGRLGGDEFGIIMMDTTLDKAVKVLDELRVEFTKLRHVGHSSVFNCTFSAGVADLEQGATINNIMKAADEALYVSKQLGRNRVSQYISPSST